MRDKLINGLNAMLDIDHKLVIDTFLTDVDSESGERVVRGIRVINGLEVIGSILGDIEPVVENGIIQRFE